MNLSSAAYLAEIAAFIGVFTGLVFFGMQMKDANLETRAATMQSIYQSKMFLVSTVVSHADVRDKVMNGEPLGPGAEQRTGIALYNLLMTENENRFRQYN